MHVAVFKFGGASVHSADGIKNVGAILSAHSGKSVMVVLSAMGKTTNALEEILHHYTGKDAVSLVERYHQLRDYHVEVAQELFNDIEHPVFGELERHFETLRTILREPDNRPEDEKYDQVVGFGELFSTTILFHYLHQEGFAIQLFDAGKLIRTDSLFRDARVDWRKTQLAVQRTLFGYFQKNKGAIGLTQGFVGSDATGKPTTLGREGSDYTAAILGYCMRVRTVTIWKDVPGILNADPAWFSEPEKLETLSYREAIELAYYGAKVVHPKTIKPLQNANISLIVNCFKQPNQPGTIVRDLDEWTITIPIYIRKQNQVLLSITPHDFSFMDEENLSKIFTLLSSFRVKAHVMQHSAISFSICADNLPCRIQPLIRELRKHYLVRFNENLELYTIRHYNPDAIERITRGRTVLLEQKSRNTLHFVMASGH